jgi:hypothetical protein
LRMATPTIGLPEWLGTAELSSLGLRREILSRLLQSSVGSRVKVGETKCKQSHAASLTGHWLI